MDACISICGERVERLLSASTSDAISPYCVTLSTSSSSTASVPFHRIRPRRPLIRSISSIHSTSQSATNQSLTQPAVSAIPTHYDDYAIVGDLCVLLPQRYLLYPSTNEICLNMHTLYYSLIDLNKFCRLNMLIFVHFKNLKSNRCLSYEQLPFLIHRLICCIF